MPKLHLIGAPSSAGSFSAGQENAPAALREAGIIRAFSGAGYDVHDYGDIAAQSWTPDRRNPKAQNVGQVVSSLTDATAAATELLKGDDRLLVLGGNCTFALSAFAALRAVGQKPSVVYVDRHFDLNTPESTVVGAFDWMGLAHALGLHGAHPDVVSALGQAPLLRSEDLVFLGVDPDDGTAAETRTVTDLAISVVTQEDVLKDARDAARRACSAWRGGPTSVHIDVDVYDFNDAPIADSFMGRNSGPSIAEFEPALTELLSGDRWRTLSIGGLNPVHAPTDPTALPRFVESLARAAQTA